MVCRKCGGEFDDGADCCPFCFEPTEKEKKKFVVSFTDEEAFGESDSVFSFDRQREYAVSFEQHENNVYSEKAKPAEERAPEEERPSVFKKDSTQGEHSAKTENEGGAKDGDENKSPTEPSAPEPKTAVTGKKRTASARRKRPQSAKANPKSSKAFLTVKIMIAVCVVLTVGLTAVGAATPIFKNSAGVGKTVALTGLSKEAQASFEDIAPALSVFFENGYDKSKVTFDDIAAYLAPDRENGLYTALFSKLDAVENQADPLGRFSDGEAYSYVSADRENISETAELLGLCTYDDINTDFCYCYEDRYYFALSETYGADTAVSETRQVKVVSSKLTSDGTYYIECELYPEDAQKDEKGNFSAEAESTVYFLADCEKNGDGFDWAVNKISRTPLFDRTGAAVSDEETDGLTYEMKTKTVKAVTSEGQTYAEYIIEYPYFAGDSVTQMTVNTLYSELISSYQNKADNADELYEEYEKSGADPERLPLKIHTVSTVTFNEKGYLSLLERTTESDPTDSAGEKETDVTPTASTEEEEPAERVQLAQTTYEGYTFEVESGDFVQKDDILGKDYQAIQKLLFETYQAQEKESSEESEASPSDSYVDNPTTAETDDPDGIGQKIYSCAWVLMPEGVGFCYQPENGGLKTVILDYGKLDGSIGL